jgi:hypothetical protein
VIGGNPGSEWNGRALAGCAAANFLRGAGRGEALRSVSERGRSRHIVNFVVSPHLLSLISSYDVASTT